MNANSEQKHNISTLRGYYRMKIGQIEKPTSEANRSKNEYMKQIIQAKLCLAYKMAFLLIHQKHSIKNSIHGYMKLQLAF